MFKANLKINTVARKPIETTKPICISNQWRN